MVKNLQAIHSSTIYLAEVHPGPQPSMRTMYDEGAGGLRLRINQEAGDREDPSYGAGVQTLSVSNPAVDRP